ncbi:hypothetical protein [Ancylobacter sp.]|uniref:hypothetical protein n=1 Tax=Ancylobacter sp. TaxID=1872567 RepID=UPI003C7EA38B
MKELLAALGALWAAIKDYIPQLVAFLVGREWEKGKQAREALSDVEKAARAAARVELLAHNDVMRELKERGLIRVSDIRDEPSNRGLDG